METAVFAFHRKDCTPIHSVILYTVRMLGEAGRCGYYSLPSVECFTLHAFIPVHPDAA